MNVGNQTNNLILLILGIIVIFTLLGATASQLIEAGDNVSASGLPLANLFGGGGIIFLIFMAGILLTIVGIALKKRGKG
jgi:hypothetical protein